jgi:hypothetical protein
MSPMPQVRLSMSTVVSQSENPYISKRLKDELNVKASDVLEIAKDIK